MSSTFRRSEDYTAEFCSTDPWQGWLMLVFSADLEEVEEVCCCGFDCYGVLVCGGSWIGDFCDGEVEGALDVFFDLNAFHGGGGDMRGVCML